MIQPKHSTINNFFIADNARKKAVLWGTTKKQKCYGASRYWTII
ncbi:MAG: hypothetical protein AB8E82_12780 [Aureispira sp.]